MTTLTHHVTVAAGRFGPGHLGELTRIISFELVDAALAATGSVQHRVRDLPSPVVVYLLIAAALFPEVSFPGVWAKLVASLDPGAVAMPTAAGLAKARMRVGPAPMAVLAGLVMPAATSPSRPGVRFAGRLVCAIDGTHLCCADTPANLSVYAKGGCHHGQTGYPLVRVLALVACGTRTLMATTFSSTARGETSYAGDLTAAMGPGMIVLADRGFAARQVITATAGTGDGGVDPDRGSFAVALRTAQDQLVRAAGVVAEGAAQAVVDLVGVIGGAVLGNLLPDRRPRVVPRVVKRAISNYAPNTRKGRLRGASYKATISIDVLQDPALTPTAPG